MKFYRSIFLIILLLVIVMIGVSCSRRNDNSNSINIFRPNSSRIDQYNRNNAKGTARPEIGTLSKSLRDYRYENDNETLFGYLAAVIGFIALIVLALLFERYLVYRMKTVADSPAALFVELCAAHQLTRMECNLIERIADAAGISDTLPVFIEPKYLQDAIINHNFEEFQQTIEYLLTKLFENRSDSSILKRSSILLQSDLNNESKNSIESKSNLDVAETTITYATTQIKNDNSNINLPIENP